MAVREKYQTKRLTIYKSNPELVEEVLDYFIRNKEFLSLVEPIRPDSYYTMEAQKRILLDDYLSVNNNLSFKFWITKTGETKIIGVLSFNGVIRGSFQSCYLNFSLDKDEVRNGYMTEAIQKGIEIAFDDLGLHRIESNIMPSNQISIDLVTKLGFVNEGLARKYLKIHGKWEDHYHMILLNERE